MVLEKISVEAQKTGRRSPDTTARTPATVQPINNVKNRMLAGTASQAAIT
jgi:hypothetical protein